MIKLTELFNYRPAGPDTLEGRLNAVVGKVVSNPYARAFAPLKEDGDHEVSMAQKQLDSIIRYATELKQKIGDTEKDIPAWIQDHISNSENYIEQANSGYYDQSDKVNEDVFVLWADRINDNLPKAKQRAKYKGKGGIWSDSYKQNAKNGHGTVFFINASDVNDAKSKLNTISDGDKTDRNIYILK
jgi:hypothetical protein